MARPFGYDPALRLNRSFHYDKVDDSFVIATEQDVTDIVESNKAEFNLFDERSGWKGEWHKVASIPLSVLFEPGMAEIVNDDRAFRRWLNDRDHSKYRTRPGRV